MPSVDVSRRLEAVDSMRFVAVIFVILIHSTPLETTAHPVGADLSAPTLVNQLARFAVPFFFIASGYFWSARSKEGTDTWHATMRLVRRTGVLFLFWSVAYALTPALKGGPEQGLLGPVKRVYWELAKLAEHPVRLALEGTQSHLWFLPALMCCALISGAMLHYRQRSVLLVLAVLAYGVGLLGNAYADTPWGIRADFNFRDGPFFGLLFFVTGHVLQRSGAVARWARAAWPMFLVGLVMHLAELSLLKSRWSTSMLQDFVLGTYLMGTAAALLALSNPQWLRNGILAAGGRLSLGIYASHYLFIDLLAPWDRAWAGQVWWEVAFPVVVLTLSVALTWFMTHHRLTRALVS